MASKKWSDNILFAGLTEKQLTSIEPQINSITYRPGELIIQEEDPGDFMILINEGSVDIFKNELKLAERVSGDMVGLMSLMDNRPRSATVFAGVAGCEGFVIDTAGFAEIMHEKESSVPAKILNNYLKYQQDAIRSTNQLSLNEAKARLDLEKQRVNSARFFVQMMVGLVVFMFLLGYLQEKANQVDSTFISFGLIVVYGILSYFYVRKSGLPKEIFGLTMSNFKPALKFAMMATAIAVPMLVLLKWILTKALPDVYGDHVIELYKVTDDAAPLWVILVLYSVHAVLQEFIVRGCLQGGLDQFLTGKKAGITAILVSTLIFSSFHLMKDMKFALLTIIPSLFWGYLFYRHKNILAVSISHIIIGLIAIFVLDIVS